MSFVKILVNINKIKHKINIMGTSNNNPYFSIMGSVDNNPDLHKNDSNKLSATRNSLSSSFVTDGSFSYDLDAPRRSRSNTIASVVTGLRKASTRPQVRPDQ